MLVYVVIILLTTLFCWLSIHIKEKELKIIFAALTILFPSIMAGIRYGIGTDYVYVYEPYFEELKVTIIPWSEDRFELAYRLINIFIANVLQLNFSWVMFIMALITHSFVYFAIINYKDKINVTIAMFTYMMLYYQMSFNLVRQCCAMAISLYALKYINKKVYIYFILIILGMLFQKTVGIMLIIPLVKKIYVNRKKKFEVIKYLSYIVLLLVILNFRTFYELFSHNELIGYYIRSYLRTTDSNIGIGAVIRVVPFLLPILFINNEIKKDKMFRLSYSLFCIGSILRLMAYVTTTFAERLALYFIIAQVLLIGYYFKNIVKHKKLISAFLIIMIVFLWYYDFFLLGSCETVPYNTIFSK